MLISLIGEQPIPNLLPIRYLQPAENLLVYTGNENASVKPAKRLRRLISASDDLKNDLLLNDAYRADKIRQQITAKLAGRSDVIFNLTGGTKPMSLAAMEVARELGAACIYYQTEGQRGRDQQSVLYFYGFDEAGHLRFDRREPLANNLLTLDDYLKAHLDAYETAAKQEPKSGDALEKAVLAAIQSDVSEWKINVKPVGTKDQAEIDLLLRRGNNVAVLEIKSGGEGSSKKALDQLTTMAAREYLGTYATRILVTRGDADARSGWYKALAQSLRVNVVEFQHGLTGERLHPQDAQTLRQRLAELLPLPSAK
jgi:hypothetical protein